MQVSVRDRAIAAVQGFWDRRPCNIRHSPREVGTREYFDEVEQRKYFVEPHILRFAEFERWGGKRILEIGCGIGTDTINFARHGARVTAVDLSKRSLDIALQRANVYGLKERIQFIHADAEELVKAIPIEPYDLIYALGVIHHTPDPERVIQQMTFYTAPGSMVKIMVYHRYSWKVFWILLKYSRGKFWRIADLIAQHSEAQEGCPITFTFRKSDIERLLNRHGFKVREIWIDHIFPFRVSDYARYRYTKEWYFRWMPRRLFRWMERTWGWHLCVTAEMIKGGPHRR
jgi:SAM-dependent methyltransferase